MTYPFGSVTPGRSFSSGSYRYGFNGKEKDDEMKGSGNSYDFGERIYDSRLGRWLSLDPLDAKYPFQSPYNSFNNSPVYYIDPDGKEGIGSVDHESKTITIKAVYFVEIGKAGFNADEFKSLNEINTTLNEQGYKVTDETNALHGYTVKFDLQFVPITSAEKAQQYAVNEKQLTESNSTGGNNLIEGGHNIANSLILTDDATFQAIPSVDETAKKNSVGADKVLGITDATLQHINIPEKSRGVQKTLIHEIFHTLYFDQDGASTGIASGKELPKEGEINTLVKGIQEQNRIVETKK